MIGRGERDYYLEMIIRDGGDELLMLVGNGGGLGRSFGPTLARRMLTRLDAVAAEGIPRGKGSISIKELKDVMGVRQQLAAERAGIASEKVA